MSLPREFAGQIDGLAPAPASVVLAVSGGADSVALFRLWLAHAHQRGDRLVVAHFDHQLRSDSVTDADFVRGLAEAFQVPFVTGHPSRPLAEESAGSLEEAARRARYAFLTETARKTSANYIATAHTADDQTETVLWSILRGTAITGLGGMPASRPLDNEIVLIRPLLGATRAQVVDYLAEVGQGYRDDPSNDDPRFTRNRLRREMLPWVRDNINPRVDAAILRLADHARDAQRLLAAMVDRQLNAVTHAASPDSVCLKIDPLLRQDPALVTAVLRELFVRQDWPRREMGQAEYCRVAQLIERTPPAACDLPGGLRAEVIIDPMPVLRIRRVKPRC